VRRPFLTAMGPGRRTTRHVVCTELTASVISYRTSGRGPTLNDPQGLSAGSSNSVSRNLLIFTVGSGATRCILFSVVSGQLASNPRNISFPTRCLRKSRPP
jgi:hypothetical protein